MPKYIDVQDIQKVLQAEYGKDSPIATAWVDWLLGKITTADVEHVVHGHWDCYCCSRFLGMKDGEPRWADGKYYYCSLCRRSTVIRENYCPKCGAKMDEKVDQ